MEFNIPEYGPKKFWLQPLTTKISQLKDEQVSSQNKRSYSVFKVKFALKAWLLEYCPEGFIIFNFCQEFLMKSLLASSAREYPISFCNAVKLQFFFVETNVKTFQVYKRDLLNLCKLLIQTWWYNKFIKAMMPFYNGELKVWIQNLCFALLLHR